MNLGVSVVINGKWSGRTGRGRTLLVAQHAINTIFRSFNPWRRYRVRRFIGIGPQAGRDDLRGDQRGRPLDAKHSKVFSFSNDESEMGRDFPR